MRPLRIVVDTNVLVSALLHPDRTPDRALAALRAHRCIVLHDPRIVAEWREVLSRKKFRGIDPARAAEQLEALLALGEPVTNVTPFEGEMTDAGDVPFVEVALAGRADALLTGNVRHYPADLGFEVMPPATLLLRLD